MPISHFIYDNKAYGAGSFQEFDLVYCAFIKGKERAFKNFLAADYFNQNEQVRDLFRRIRQAINKEVTVLRGAAIIKDWELQFKQKLNGEDLERVLLHLMELSLDFVAHQKVKEDKITKQRIIQRSLRHKQLDNYLTKSVRATKRALAKQPVGMELTALKLLLTLETYYDSATDHEKHGFALLNSLDQQVEYLYQLMITKLKCERENLRMAARKPAKASSSRNSSRIKADLLHLYQLNLSLHQAPGGFSIERFTAFTEAFMPVHQHLDETERFILCKYTINAVNRGVKKGEADLSLLFEWTKYRLEWTPSYIREESANDYLNTLNIACTCRELNYAEAYLEKYYARLPLPAKEAEKIYVLGQAEILFLKAEYLKLLQLLGKEFPRNIDQHYSILFRVKTLRLKTCTSVLLMEDKAALDSYEMAEEEYDAALADLRLYSSRSSASMPKHFQNAYQSFRQLVEKILRVRSKPYSKNEKRAFGEQLLHEIEEAKSVVARAWLKDMIKTYFIN